MNSPLVRCSTCKRHIYASEPSCPFCTRQAHVSPTLLAAALTAGIAIAGCGSEATRVKTSDEAWPHPDSREDQLKDPAEDPKPEPPPPGPNVSPAPVYGAPPSIEPRPAPPAAAYGAPPPMQTPTNPR